MPDAEAWRQLRQMVRDEYGPEATADDKRAMEKAFGEPLKFYRLTEDCEATAFADFRVIKGAMEIGVDLDAHTEVTKRAEDARKLQLLKYPLEVLSDKGSVHLRQTALEMTKRFKITEKEAIEEVYDLEDKAQRVFECSAAVQPKGPRRSGPLPALIETMLVVDVLERASIKIAATGGDEGGPFTRLLGDIFKYTSGKAVSPDAVKQRLKTVKKHNAGRTADKGSTRVRS
jgi:hypothetical protein